MNNVKDLDLQFVLDNKGNRTGVIIPIRQFYELIREFDSVKHSRQSPLPREQDEQPETTVQAMAAADAPDESATAPAWEMVCRLGASVAREQWEKPPSELAQNLDMYLYNYREANR